MEGARVGSGLRYMKRVPASVRGRPLGLICSGPRRKGCILASICVKAKDTIVTLRLRGSKVIVNVTLYFLILDIVSLLVAICLGCHRVPSTEFHSMTLFLVVYTI